MDHFQPQAQGQPIEVGSTGWWVKGQRMDGGMNMVVAFHLVQLCHKWYVADKHHSTP